MGVPWIIFILETCRSELRSEGSVNWDVSTIASHKALISQGFNMWTSAFAEIQPEPMEILSIASLRTRIEMEFMTFAICVAQVHVTMDRTVVPAEAPMPTPCFVPA